MSYDDWIAAYHERLGGGFKTLGRCQQASREMKAAFPELEIVKGHVHCPEPWGKRGHWWLVDPEGNIVDPTAAQFPLIFEYEPYREGDEIRVGTCMDCGEALRGQPGTHRTFCDKTCEETYLTYMNGGAL